MLARCRQEILSDRGGAEEKVVVQIEEVLRESRDRMNEALDGRRVEGRQIGGEAAQLVVVDDIHSRVAQVEPHRDLRATRDDVDIPDPAREHGHRPEAVAQQIVQIARPLRVEVVRARGVAGHVRLKPWVVSIDPRVYEVDSRPPGRRIEL